MYVVNGDVNVHTTRGINNHLFILLLSPITSEDVQPTPPRTVQCHLVHVHDVTIAL